MDKDRPVTPTPVTPEKSRDVPHVRSGNFFRAAVVGTIAALAPAAGCYESEPEPTDAADADARDADAPTDTVVEDGTTDYPVPYGVPEYGTPDYGAPVYSSP